MKPGKRDAHDIEERSRQLFAESVAGLDGATRSRLRQARARAVAAAAGRGRLAWFAPAWPAASRLVPAGAIAAALLAVVVYRSGPDAVLEPVAAGVVGDLEILLDEQELDLLEDLEFYAWLLEQPEMLEVDADGDGSG